MKLAPLLVAALLLPLPLCAEEAELKVLLWPAGEATGAGVVVIPGGGHRYLAIEHEGYAVARWLSEHGIAGFVLADTRRSQDIVPVPDSPPVFLACGYNDRLDISEGLAGVRPSDHSPAAGWPERFRDWLADRGMLTPQWTGPRSSAG
jgi:hypothetical protein